MSQENLTEREFELVNIVGDLINANQREISRHMDLSLGTINMLIRRLINKGYIRIRQLNKRKVEYILTPKGFSEKMRKSVKYALKTIRSIELIKERVKAVVLKFYEKGERDFYVLGRSDFAFLIDMVFKENNIGDVRIQHINELGENTISGVILVCKEDVKLDENLSGKSVDLIKELAMDKRFVNHNNEKVEV